MIDVFALVWIFANAAASSALTPVAVVSAVTAVLTAPTTVAVVRYLDNRREARERERAALIDSEKARALAQIQADAATRRAEEEEETGQHILAAERHKIDAPMMERVATADRAERVATQAKYEQSLFTIADLDRELASANERVRVLNAQCAEQARVIARQAEAIIALSEQNDGLYAWIEEYFERNPGACPKPPKHGRVIAIEEIVTSAKDERRES